MSCCNSQPFSNQLIKLTTERLKVLRVIGEKIGQIAAENKIEIHAVKIDHIDASVKDLTDHVFTDKIVKQGVIHSQIFYVDPNGFVRETSDNVPFILAVDIPGVIRENPWLEIEDKLLKIETDYTLVPETCNEPGILKHKIVADFLVKVSEWVQLDVVVRPNFFTKIEPMKTIVIRS
ncbi:MAG TPA: hypothetical protein DDW50_03185 [Firmicutes bacterium]|jgi:hypothetical protein|nr:hypothetical protein [Bacillota bacterium]